MSKQFVNPYNFIPLSKGNIERSNERDLSENKSESLYTGKINYSVKTVTPLFIPNTSNDKLFGAAAKHQDSEAFRDKQGADGSKAEHQDSKAIWDKRDTDRSKAEHEESKEYHKSYDFFSYNDLSGCVPGKVQPYYTPVIPGSEMRGAIRNIYEALTDSCLSALEENEIFSRRTPERYNPGLLVRNKDREYTLKEAEDYIYRINDDFSVPFLELPDISEMKDGTEVFYNITNKPREKFAKKIVEIVTKPSDGCENEYEKGYIIKGQDGPVLPKPKDKPKCQDCPEKTKKKCKKNNEEECYLLMKHNVHVFAESKGGKWEQPKSWKISDQNIVTLDNVLNIYKKNNPNAYKEYRESWEKFKAGDINVSVIPVYYSVLQSEDGKIEIFLSPACITREVYQNTLKKVLGNHYLPCQNNEHLCPACKLFGTVNTGLSRASSIRFSDLKAEHKKNTSDYYDDLLTLDELGQPRLSSMEFYLKKPEVSPGELLTAWTFDYYITVDVDGKPRVHFYTPDIAGRKFYWHSEKAVERQNTLDMAISKEEEWHKTNPDQDKYITKRNKTIRPVRSGIAFYGEVYFNQITETQLKQLIAVLNMSRSEQYGIKIGGAKSLGLGSVKLNVQNVNYRKVLYDEGKLTYQSEIYKYQDIDISAIFDARLLKAFDFNTVDENKYEVAYPFVDSEKDNGFAWFGNNRKSFSYGIRVDNYGKEKKDYSRLDVYNTTDGPSARIQVPYRKYMKALSPELVDSGFDRAFEIGKDYSGKVVGYNPSGRFAQVKLDYGGKASFKDINHKYENQCVKLRYAGKNYSGYDMWELVH